MSAPPAAKMPVDAPRCGYSELILGIAAFCAATLLMAGIVWINLDRVEQAVARDEQARAVLLQADEVLDALVNQETGARGYDRGSLSRD